MIDVKNLKIGDTLYQRVSSNIYKWELVAAKGDFSNGHGKVFIFCRESGFEVKVSCFKERRVRTFFERRQEAIDDLKFFLKNISSTSFDDIIKMSE